MSSLYYTVKNVYAPMLLKSDKWSSQFNPQLQELLSDLETGLRKSLQHKKGW